MEEILVRLGLDKQSAFGILWSFVPNIISAFVVVVLVIFFYYITARIFEAALRKTTMQDSLIKITVRSLYRGLVIIVGLILVLGQLGINVTAAIAGVGVLGLAVGFAAQQTLANIFSGFGIFVDKLYAAGDWVRVADNYGEVVSISLRTTKIRTLDNTFISVPNSLVTSSPVTNYSEEGLLRITARVSIGYKESVDKARRVLLEAVSGIKGVKKKPIPMVVVDKLGESSVELLVRIWVDEPGFEQKYFFLLTEACKQALDKAKISIPFPQRDIHIISEPKRKVLKKK
jgi:small conductance mechanosensitive channel